MTTQTQVRMTATCPTRRAELRKRGPLPRGVNWSNTVRLRSWEPPGGRHEGRKGWEGAAAYAWYVADEVEPPSPEDWDRAEDAAALGRIGESAGC